MDLSEETIRLILEQNRQLLAMEMERRTAVSHTPIFPHPTLTLAPSSATLRRVREEARAYYDGEGYSLDSASAVRSRTEAILETEIPSRRCKFGDLPLDQVDKALLAEYRKVRKNKGKTRYGKAPSAATRNREVALICRWFSWGHDEGHGCKLLERVPKEKEDNVKKGVRISDEQMLGHLLECCDQVGTKGVMRALVLALIDTGMRIEEVRSLRWDAFDHETGRVALLEEETKGDDARVPRLSCDALAAVMALPRVCDHVFASEKFKRLYSERHVKQMFDDAMRLSGLKWPEGKKFTLHSLRHSFVYRARRIFKMPRDVIMKITGHKTDSAFRRYGIVDREEVDEAFDRRDETLAELRRGPKAATPLPVNVGKTVDGK